MEGRHVVPWSSKAFPSFLLSRRAWKTETFSCRGAGAWRNPSPDNIDKACSSHTMVVGRSERLHQGGIPGTRLWQHTGANDEMHDSEPAISSSTIKALETVEASKKSEAILARTVFSFSYRWIWDFLKGGHDDAEWC